jgi:acyl-CoA synthetase (AMP-forming)/AMP-acid ligase II
MKTNNCNPHFFFNAIAKFGDAIAVIEKGKSVSYSQLSELVEQRKLQINTQLVFPSQVKQVIGLMAENTLATLVNYIALLQLNHVILFLPKQRLYSSLSASEDANEGSIAWSDKLVTDYRLSVCVVENEILLNPKFKKPEAQTETFTDTELTHTEPTYKQDRGITSNIANIALLLSTSGSTGASKQVMISYDNLHANTTSICDYLPIKSTDVSISTLPFHYSYGLSIINTHLASGAALLMTEYSFMQREFWSLFDEHKVTSFGGVPHSYDMLMRLKFTSKNLPSLRYFTQAGGKLAVNTVSELSTFAEKSGKAFYVMYGQTEATARMSFADQNTLLSKPDTIGKAIPGTSFSIQGELGELVFTGPNVMLGYAHSLNDLQQQTLMTETPRHLNTGDLAKVDADGDIYITGRVKRIVKLFGERISLDELQSSLQEYINKKNELLHGQAVECVCVGEDSLINIVLVTNFITNKTLVEQIATQQKHGNNISKSTHDVKNIIESDTKAVLKNLGIRTANCRMHWMDSLPRTESCKVDYAKLTSLLSEAHT